MKISIFTLILPRLEVFFLEEWINHHLKLGVEKVYIYDNGMSSNDDASMYGGNAGRNLTEVETKIKWLQKPDADYLEEYTDVEIYEKLNEVVGKFEGVVEVVSWKVGIDHNDIYPASQTSGYRHCAETNYSDWWLFIDVDEFIMLKSHETLIEFIGAKHNQHKKRQDRHNTSFNIFQRVFDGRARSGPVREIFNWGYELSRSDPKTLVKHPIDWSCGHHTSLHRTMSTIGRRRHTKMNEVCIYHYRGPSKNLGSSPKHKRHQNATFDKFDDGMKKYFNND